MKTLCAILLSFAATFGCDYMAMPTDFTTVAAGTRANLGANFGETENKFNPCADSVRQVRARLSNYTTSLTVTSLENLRLRLDGDATATGLFLVEGSSGDSLFRVSESLNARLFGHVAIDSNLTARKVTAADSLIGPSLTLSGLTASRLVATNAGKTAASVSDLTSWIAGTANQITSTSDGDGTLTLSLPSAVTFPGTVTSTGLFTASAGVSSTTGAFSGTATIGSGSGAATLVINGGAASSRTLSWQTNGTARWAWIADNASESGSDAGSKIFLRAFTDAGATIDSPIDIVRASGGTMTLSRPVSAARLNLNSAVDNASFPLNVIGPIANSGTNAILSFGSGVPGDANYERVSLIHTGSAAELRSQAGGTGTVEPLRLVVGSTTRYDITNAGVHTVTGDVDISASLDVAGAVTAASITLGGGESFTAGDTTFTLTGTGFTSSPTGTARGSKFGNIVVLYIPAIQATSNSSALTYTGIPTSWRPARKQTVSVEAIQDNTTNYLTGFIDVETTGTLTVTPRTSFTALGGFTSSGVKGISGFTITYSLL